MSQARTGRKLRNRKEGELLMLVRHGDGKGKVMYGQESRNNPFVVEYIWPWKGEKQKVTYVEGIEDWRGYVVVVESTGAGFKGHARGCARIVAEGDSEREVVEKVNERLRMEGLRYQPCCRTRWGGIRA